MLEFEEERKYKTGKVNGLDVISFAGKIKDLVDVHGQEFKETSQSSSYYT